LQPLTATTDTSIVIINTTSPYIAVSTVLQENNTGVNSYTFNYNNQGVGCYISSFLADLTIDKTTLLQLSLGTTFNVTMVQFQQLTTNGWQTLQTIDPVTDAENSYEANTLHAGINTFRAVVTLSNGTPIISEEVVFIMLAIINLCCYPTLFTVGKTSASWLIIFSTIRLLFMISPAAKRCSKT
jgi:hypothetical protein